MLFAIEIPNPDAAADADIKVGNTYEAVPNSDPVIPDNTFNEPLITADPDWVSDPDMIG